MKEKYNDDILNKSNIELNKTMKNNEDLDYKLYVLAELAYMKTNNKINEKELFPTDWYSMRNYKLKVEMIGEALKNNCLIKETDKYQDNINCIKLQK